MAPAALTPVVFSPSAPTACSPPFIVRALASRRSFIVVVRAGFAMSASWLSACLRRGLYFAAATRQRVAGMGASAGAAARRRGITCLSGRAAIIALDGDGGVWHGWRPASSYNLTSMSMAAGRPRDGGDRRARLGMPGIFGIAAARHHSKMSSVRMWEVCKWRGRIGYVRRRRVFFLPALRADSYFVCVTGGRRKMKRAGVHHGAAVA